MARSIDCRSVSLAERVPDCGDGDQWPKERKPIFFMMMFPDCGQNLVPVQYGGAGHDWKGAKHGHSVQHSQPAAFTQGATAPSSDTLTVYPEPIKPQIWRINLQSEVIGEKVFADKQRTKTGEIFMRSMLLALLAATAIA